ncbi:DUF1822 family protein [Allocoleopsis sp.]|uniref:DUF1822 family protein n=1 Tax=Allocoleopsis sp. TaxID=3088169 RepID=UPI002FD68C38
MVSSPINSMDLGLLPPEIIWLEPEHFERAIEISNSVKSEAQQWQTYLNALALVSFEEWLSTRIPNKTVNRDTKLIEAGGYLKVGEFKLYLIATEHLLDEVVNLPQAAIEQLELIAHFYVVLEVLEEQEQVLVRGVGRYDQVLNYFRQSNLQVFQDSYYQLPLSLFDTEPNDLVVYCRLLEPTAILLPFASTNSQVASEGITSSALVQATDTYEFSLVLPEYLTETRTKLSQWLQGVFDEAWLGLDALISPEADLAVSTRNAEEATTRGKLINLEMQLGSQTVALLVAIAEEAQEKLGILIQLHPTGGKRYLPSSLKLTLLSKAGKILHEVQARDEDNYIQLIPFKGKPGKRFSIEVSLRNISVREDFEL